MTALVQTQATVRNLTQNLDHYTSRPGIAELAGSTAGRPAIVVSAGPSLERALDLLARPGVRERFVIVAVQTVLRTLLRRGIKPDADAKDAEVGVAALEVLRRLGGEAERSALAMALSPASPAAFRAAAEQPLPPERRCSAARVAR